MKWLGFPCVVLVGLVAASLPQTEAWACPDLSGTFECPASGKQPPLTLLVKTKNTVDDGALYTMTYRIMGRDMPAEYEAAPKSQHKPGDAVACEGNVLIHNEGNGESVRMSIDAQGNFQRVKDGKIDEVCTKKAN